ncbi:MAG TPA: DivIVA domain-containing protein [Longimicrobiaceae bacterium]|nr:DivIVA domain-containing protein [Longimicrobiaceae bacterium]
MIDLTPLDVRKKKGDFRRGLRGYEPAVVDDYLDLVAERLEELVRENATYRERSAQLTETVTAFREREQAMNDALVSAQQLREEFRAQASRDADLLLREARSEAERIIAEAKRQALAAGESARRVHAQRARFLRTYRSFIERQLADVEQEEGRVRADVEASRARPGGDQAKSDGDTPGAAAGVD